MKETLIYVFSGAFINMMGVMVGYSMSRGKNPITGTIKSIKASMKRVTKKPVTPPAKPRFR